MRILAAVCPLLLIAPMLGQPAAAQSAPQQPDKAKTATQPLHFYHLDFVVQELNEDGKPINSRSYSTTLSSQPNSEGEASIRTNSRIPIATSSSTGSNPASENVQYQYIDVGVNFDARNAHEVGSELAFNLTADVSSVGAAIAGSLPHEPTIRQNKWQAIVLIPIGKPTVLFTSDDLDSKGSMRVTVTATPIN